MFFNPNFLARKTGNSSDIHNDSSQPIQGGVAGEHYHLSAALYQALINLINNPRSIESVVTNSSAAVYVDGGDIVTVSIAIPPAPSPAGGVTIPSTGIPDIVSPTNPVVVEPEFPSIPTDPYWNNVVLLAPLDGELFTTVYTTYDKYAIAAKSATPPSEDYVHMSFAGADSQHVNTLPRYGKNTVKAAGAVGGSRGPYGTPAMFSGRQGNFIGDFTAEADLAFDATHLRLWAIGNSVLNVHAEILADGTGKFAIAYGSVDSTVAGESAAFVFPWVADRYYHTCIERKGDRIQLRIDSVLCAEIKHTGTYQQGFFYAAYFANFRITQAIARYNLSDFVLPTAPYPRG